MCHSDDNIIFNITRAVEKKEKKTEAEVVGQHQERLVGDRIVRVGSARPS